MGNLFAKLQEAPAALFKSDKPQGVGSKPLGRRIHPSTDTFALPEVPGPTGSVRLDGGRPVIQAHPATARSFKVTPLHERLAGGGGVRFAVEDTAADPADKKMPPVCRYVELQSIQREAAAFYGNCGEDAPVAIEQASATPKELVYSGGHGFLAAVLTAFARHLPLVLAPDHVWALISFAVAQHVEKHAEELRHHFVAHEGKKRLVVVVDESFTPSLGSRTFDTFDTAATPDRWEREVFPELSAQIKAHIGAETHAAVAGEFSTTTPAARAAHEIALMAAMKHYFSYGMVTKCGIPAVTLLGTREDWAGLRARAVALGDKMTPAFRKLWLPKLLPVLDQFVAAHGGEVHHGFWQSMVKMRHYHATSSGESSADYITGWVQILYPYLAGGEVNAKMQPWEKCYFEGPKTGDFPPTLSAASVDWENAPGVPGLTLDLHFHAGVTGFTQDPADGALTPVLGWRVTHAPPSRRRIIARAEAEIAALTKGMAGDAAADKAALARIAVLERRR